MLRKSNLDVTIFRPTMMYGKGSKEFGTFVNVIKYCPVVPLVGSGKNIIQPIYIGDAIDVIIASIDNGTCVGRTYDLAGATPISFDDFVKLICQTLKLRRRFIIHLPASVFLFGSKWLGKVVTHVPITVDQVMSFIQDTKVDLRPLEKDFNFFPCTLEDGLSLVL